MSIPDWKVPADLEDETSRHIRERPDRRRTVHDVLSYRDACTRYEDKSKSMKIALHWPVVIGMAHYHCGGNSSRHALELSQAPYTFWSFKKKCVYFQAWLDDPDKRWSQLRKNGWIEKRWGLTQNEMIKVGIQMDDMHAFRDEVGRNSHGYKLLEKIARGEPVTEYENALAAKKYELTMLREEIARRWSRF